jgi:hypothetical protein
VTRYPFGYCAVRYFVLWQRSEKQICKGFEQRPTPDALRSALGYFRVARGFRRIKEDEVAESTIELLLSASSRTIGSRQEGVRAVCGLADEFERAFGRRNLSAASKLLWLSQKSPFVLYDSRARSALINTYDATIESGDYAAFCDAWNSKFTESSDALQSAISSLRNAGEYVPDFSLSEADLVELEQSAWFKERVFDIHLWELGEKL